MMRAAYLPATPDHWPALSVWLPTVLAGNWTVGNFAAMQAADHQLRVLADAGEAVGFAEFQWVADECQLHNFAIMPARRREGLGERLLLEVLAESRRNGRVHCVLEVRESNLAARRLYGKCGFTECGRRPRYYPSLLAGGERETAVLYSCGSVSSASI